MKILVTGSSGLIGTALVESLSRQGQAVTRYNRAQPPALDDFEAVVHLAGANISSRWTTAKKQQIYSSRVDFTRQLSTGLARAAQPPRVLICASAIGFYGDRGSELLTEESLSGTGFLAGVVTDWESATAPARQAGIRVANLRVGIVLDARQGALAKMLPAFKLGAGGRVGSGRQYWSWVDVADVVGAMEHVLATDSIRGPINVVAPQAVTNREFTQTLGRVLRRPTLLPLPAVVVKILLGEMSQLLLASARVRPVQLEASGYRFRYPLLDDSLRHLLGR
ncbi:MAG: TIGR01777 family oxidoreductase [Verrucomicrobiota bacterium]